MFGLFQGIANAFMAKKANKELGNLLNQDPTYTENPLSRQRFGLANNLFFGRMAGAPELERNIFTNNANFNSNVQRNAADQSQALALAAAGQGQTDSALQNLQTEEKQNKYSMLGNLNNSYSDLINEQDKVYNDKVRRFGDLSSIKGAQVANKANAVNGIFNGLSSDVNDAINIFSLGQGGMFGKGFMGGSGSGSANSGQQPLSWSQMQGFPNINYGLINSSYPKFTR